MKIIYEKLKRRRLTWLDIHKNLKKYEIEFRCQKGTKFSWATIKRGQYSLGLL